MKPVPVQTARRGRRPEGLPPVASTSGRGCRIFIPFAVEWRSSCRAVSAHRPVGGGMPAAECLVSEGSDVEIKRCGSAGLFVRCVANRRLRSASFGVCSVGGDFGPRDTYALRMIGALLCQSAAGEGRVGRHRRDDAALRMGRLRAAALRLRPKSETFKTVFRLAEFAVRCAQTGCSISPRYRLANWPVLSADRRLRSTHIADLRGRRLRPARR